VPIWYLRLVPALSGSLLPVAAYYLMKEFHFSRWTAAFAAAVIIMGIIYMTFSNSLYVAMNILSS